MTRKSDLPRYEFGELAGQLMDATFPGLYPLFYLDSENSVLCPKCARKSDSEDELPNFRPVACDANYEDPNLYCDQCSQRIPSAYAEEEEENA